MPRCCSVIGCKSNYKSEKNSKYVTVFSLPSDLSIRNRWLSNIPNHLHGLKHPVVCIKHFAEQDIVRVDKCIVKGKVKIFERKIPKLVENSVPTIFANVPEYLDEKTSTSTQLVDVEKHQVSRALDESLLSLEEHNKSRHISNFNDIQTFYTSSSQIDKNWVLIQDDENVLLCYLNLQLVPNKPPEILASVVINKGLTFTVNFAKYVLKCNKLPKKLQSQKLLTIDLLEELLEFVQGKLDNLNAVVSDKIDVLIDKSSNILNECQSECDSDSDKSVLHSFISEQLQLYKMSPENIRSKDSCSSQLEVLVNTGDTITEIENRPDVFKDELRIKEEEIDIKEEIILENQVGSNDSYSTQLEVKTEDGDTISGIDKIPEVFNDEWKINEEEIDIKEDNVLENQVDTSSGLFNQDNNDIETKSRMSNYGANHEDNVNHHTRHTNPQEVDLFKCDKCEYRTRLKCYLKSHLMKHKNPVEVYLFKCDKCEYRTRYKGNLRNHFLKHENPDEADLFKCDLCEYQTRYKGALKIHLLRHANPEEADLFKCDKCEYQTYRNFCINRHVLKHKSAEEVELFKCDKCEYQVRSKSAIKIHLLGHENPEGIDLYKCYKCEYQTYRKFCFKRHILRHKNSEEVDLFKCHKCEYQARYKSSLKRHLLRHRNTVKRHLLRHGDLVEVNMFKCDKCEYQTRYKSALKTHVFETHKP